MTHRLAIPFSTWAILFIGNRVEIHNQDVVNLYYIMQVDHILGSPPPSNKGTVFQAACRSGRQCPYSIRRAALR